MVQGLRNSWVITVGIRATVHLHEVLLDTHTQASNLTANVSVYVIVVMIMCLVNVLALMFSVKNICKLVYFIYYLCIYDCT